MRGCLQVLATLAAALFVVTAVLAMFTVNLAQVITDREAVEQMLDAEALVVDVVPRLLTEAALEQARAQGSPPANPDSTNLQAAIRELFPPGWLEIQRSVALDAVFDFLETGDPKAAELQIDAGPVSSRLRGEPGRRVVLAVLQLLPQCTEPQSATPPEADLSEINYCLPPDVPITDVTTYTHDGLIEIIDQAPQSQAEAGIIHVPLLAEGTMIPRVRERSQWLHQLFVLGQRWARALWLVPLSCLLLLLLTRHSLNDLSYWLGWSLLVAALIALLLAILVPPFLSATMLRLVSAPSDLPRVFLGRLAQHLLDTLTERWMRRVYVQTGLMLACGVVLVVVDYIQKH